MKVALSINGETRTADVEPRKTLLDCLREDFGLTGSHTGCEHGVCGACTVLLDGEPARSCLIFAVQADGYEITTIEGIAPAPGELSVIQDAFCEMHGMQCGYCTPGMVLTATALLRDNPQPTREQIAEAISGNICRCTGYGQIIEAIALAARAAGARQCAESGEAMSTAPRHLRYVSSNRRVREDRRFVAGMGQFAADVKAANMLHVALVPSPHPAARIVSIDAKAALALPGVHYVLSGEELAGAVDQLMNGLETPEVRRYPLAVKQARYVGEWVAAVVADTRAIAEDAAELVEVTYEPLPFVIDPEEALKPDAPKVHPPHGSNVLLDRTFVWGDVEGDFAQSPRHLSFRVVWGRSSTVPVETFGITAVGIRGANCSTSGPRSRCPNMPTRSRARCGFPPMPCACIMMSMSAAAMASSAASSTPCCAPISRAAWAAQCG